MRRLFNLMVVLAMILALTGSPAGAGRPDLPPPTITLSEPTATCVAQSPGSGFDLELTLAAADLVIDNGELAGLNMDAARIGTFTMADSGYSETLRTESWWRGWWEGDGDAMPTLPYGFNTADAYVEGDGWDSHNVTAVKTGATITDTGYWNVGVWVDAVATPPKGKRSSARAWVGQNWVFQCMSAGPAVLSDAPEFEWCWEDDYTHTELGDGLWTWSEADNKHVACPTGGDS